MDSGNDLSPARHQAITWTHVGLLSSLRINLREIKIWRFSFKNHLKMSSIRRRPFCLGLKALTVSFIVYSWLRGCVATCWCGYSIHYNDVIMNAMASQITGVSIVCITVCSGADLRKHQSSASLAFVRGIHRWPLISPHKGPVTRKCFHLMTSSWYFSLK